MASMILNDESPVYEGFLCPMCLQNFDTVYKLQSHVEGVHGSEDKAVLHQLKGFFSRAKRLITNKSDDHVQGISKGDTEESARQESTVLLGTDPYTWQSKDLGVTTSHFEFLRHIRSDRIDRTVVEINKLVIRLEKLIRLGPPWNDQAKRKVYEKAVVPWAEDGDVRFCPSCGDKFSLAVRRHHCRLCGGIMCNKCSSFVGIPFCEQVLDPAAGKSKVKQRETEESPGKKGNEVTLRVCEHCLRIMEKRLSMVQERITKPVIVQLYEKMMEIQEQITKQFPLYDKMAKCLMNGEDTYTYVRAERERATLLKYFDALDMLSKKIYTLGSGSDKSLTTAQMKLRKNIRAEAIRFLQDHMMRLNALPSEEEVARLQANRRAAIARRLEEERQARAQRQQAEAKALEKSLQKSQVESKLLESPKKGHERKSSWGLLNKLKEQAQEVGAGMMGGLSLSGSDGRMPEAPSGWKPSAVSQESVKALSDDPLVQQMNIISSYLNQAQEAGRWDEVSMLEANLKELQLAYKQEKRGTQGHLAS